MSFPPNLPAVPPAERSAQPPADPSLVAPPPALRWQRAVALYLALQFGGLGTLGIAWVVITALAPLFGADGRSFLEMWGTSFIVVPLTFVPVLAAWHSWAVRRIGRRPATLRFMAETAFATELIGCVLFQGIA